MTKPSRKRCAATGKRPGRSKRLVRWTLGDEDILIEMWLANRSCEQISDRLERTPNAVAAKAAKLTLPRRDCSANAASAEAAATANDPRAEPRVPVNDRRRHHPAACRRRAAPKTRKIHHSPKRPGAHPPGTRSRQWRRRDIMTLHPIHATGPSRIGAVRAMNRASRHRCRMPLARHAQTPCDCDWITPCGGDGTEGRIACAAWRGTKRASS